MASVWCSGADKPKPDAAYWAGAVGASSATKPKEIELAVVDDAAGSPDSLAVAGAVKEAQKQIEL
jgi:hypothetical protein